MMETRIMVVRTGCEYCSAAKRAINLINMKLPFDKQIRIINNFDWEFYGTKTHPVLDLLGKDFDSYPFIYIDGVIVEPCEPSELLTIAVAKLVEDDLFLSIQVGNKIIGG